MTPYNGIFCETCEENERQARTAVAVNHLFEKSGNEKEKEKGKEKRTRLPDKFNQNGKPRISRQDKYLPLKSITSKKKKDRSQFRRIKYDFYLLV